MVMGQRKKGSVLWTQHIQVCVSSELREAFKAYAEDEYEGNSSQAARRLIQKHLEDMGYLETTEKKPA